MPAVLLECLTDSDVGWNKRATGCEHSEKTKAAARNSVVEIPSTRRRRMSVLRTLYRHIRYRFLIHVDRDQECGYRNNDVRKIHEQIR